MSSLALATGAASVSTMNDPERNDPERNDPERNDPERNDPEPL